MIDTGDADPIRMPYRRIPYHLRKFVEHEIEVMLRRGIIRPSTSPWQAPILMVSKPDGSYRMCMDARKSPNSVTKLRGGQIPLIRDLLESLGRKKYISVIDLQKGYLQARLSEDSIEKASFVTHMGQFEFLVLPFGILSAPMWFQEQMAKVLVGLPNIRLFIDDILIGSETLEQHMRDIKTVFKRLSKYGLIVNVGKCRWLLPEVKFLGNIVSRSGISVDPEKAHAINKLLPPKTVKQLKMFLGASGFFRSSIFQYAKIASPLYGLTSKNVPFVWTPQCDAAFRALKHKLITAPCLAYPNFSGKRPLLLHCDASGDCVGSVLLQEGDDGKMHPFIF